LGVDPYENADPSNALSNLRLFPLGVILSAVEGIPVVHGLIVLALVPR